MRPATDELTGSEQAVLLVLMAESRPVANPELNDLGPKLDKASREKLNRLRFIDSTQVGRSYVHELTDKGWRRCGELFGAPTPPRPSGQGKALYTLLNSLGRYFSRADLRAADVFWPAGTPEPHADADGVEDLVRRAYARLAAHPGDWVGLVRLRAELADVARPDLDAALVTLYRVPGVSLIPEENQKVLTAADRAAAVDIGDQDKHLIAIEQ
ncbi:MAG: hypothetical protein JWR37_4 [Mycobacterium sp.]|nr:hypothetical protein [Mycobacterium sp.]